MRYGMVIDLKRCSGCKTCSVVCKVANNIPNDIIWNRVLTEGGNAPDTAGGTWGNPEMQHWPVACQHCENPACTKVCPVGATWKDEQTGIVRQDYDKCIGCRMCMAACPYNARTFNWNDPVRATGASYGDARVPERARGVMEKCTLCKERTDEGDEPMCVRCCPADARIFGDLDDPNSEINAKIKELGAKLVVSRAARDVHAKFLLRNGADDVIYPEKQTASWAAVRYSSDHVFDYIKLTPDHSIYETAVPESWVGRTVVQLAVRQKYRINILAIKRSGTLEPLPGPNHTFQSDETLLILGDDRDIQRFLHV